MLKRIVHIALCFLVTTWILALSGSRVSAQTTDPGKDSLKVVERVSEARELLDSGESFPALNVLGEALTIAMQLRLETYEALILELIGDIYMMVDDPEEAIPYFIRVASMFEYRGDSVSMVPVYLKTGDAYLQVTAYERAGEYYQKARSLPGGLESTMEMMLMEKLGSTSLLSGNYKEAQEYYARYEELLVAQGEIPVAAWTQLVQASRAAGDFDQCVEHSLKLLSHYVNTGDLSATALMENNLGYYLTELGRYPEALEYYEKAALHAESAGMPSGEVAVRQANMGVCYQNMNEPDEAKDYLNDALSGLKGEEYSADRSRIENIQALIYFNENDLYNAGSFCRGAISSAELAGEARLLADAYLTYSNVLRAGNDPVSALRYYESYLAIRDSLQLEALLKEEQRKQMLARLDRAENDLLLRLREERVNELAINELTLQLEREEQARELLARESDLQLLEQERLRQSLVITEQQHRVEQQERQNRILEQEQRIARLALEQEQQKQKESEQEIRLLEQQQRLVELSQEKQKKQRQALLGIVFLMILVVVLVTGSLISTRRKKRQLARQKKEIEEKNLDLEHKNEEISAQRDEIEAQRDEIEAQRNLLFDQKEEIEQNSVEITNSIEYAERIQMAALPNLGLLDEFVDGYFLLFMPRDIVSGDFYWVARVEGLTVLVVADCTGHGVPGAFMSMMGMSLLKEIVQKEYLTHPGVILRRMRKEIIRSLGQKGTAGEQRDGMDISLIEINHQEQKVQFAGAYNSLYLVRDRAREAPDIEGMTSLEGENGGDLILYDIPGDRMPVAFHDRMDKFTTHEFRITKGDQLYMYTDGFADQFGGERGKKFKYRPFKNLILSHANLAMEEQNKALTGRLLEWKGEYDQVDDICMIGLRF